MQTFKDEFGELTSIMRGIVVSIILVPSALTGMLAGNVSDRISRKYAIGLGAAVFGVGSVLSAAAVKSLAMLIVGRCIAGAGEGLFLGCLGVYLTEISPRHLRSLMIVIQQIFCTGAIATAFFVCYGTVKIPNSIGWRLPFILQTITSIVLAVGSYFMPYSVRWLLSNGRREEAQVVLDFLAGPETAKNAEERRELVSVTGIGQNRSQLDALRDIWRADVRGRTVLGIALNVFQQLSGIDFVLFYAPLLFNQAGLDPSTSSFVASGCTGIVILVCTVIGTLYIERVGRRRIWLVGGSATASCHLVLGILYATGAARGNVGRFFVIAFIELFAISFVLSWSLVTKLYAAEIQPMRTRAAATSTGQGLNQLANFAVAVSGPAFLEAANFGPYFMYGGFTALGVIFAFVFMPEVRGKTLEGIDSTFQGSSVAVSWPKVFSAAQLSEVRQRKNSRSHSTNLPGETREEIRAHVAMKTIGEDDDNAVSEE
ncbi:hypothetical protein JCM8202v2_003405 [Rhodotorula sphaerocarpa]